MPSKLRPPPFSKGFERTGEFEGHRSYQKWQKAGERGEIKLLVAGRFTVEVKGRKAKWEALEAAGKGVDLDGLEGLKDSGKKLDE